MRALVVLSVVCVSLWSVYANLRPSLSDRAASVAPRVEVDHALTSSRTEVEHASGQKPAPIAAVATVEEDEENATSGETEMLAQAQAAVPSAAESPAGSPSAESSEDKPAPRPRRRVSVAEMCDSIAEAAESNNLPIGFLVRLIWQESGFDSSVVSSAGAQGVAQFMPQTAAEWGLDDPFDPLQALPTSARMLRSLQQQFGNLGLAAAAYNAGAGRIQNWLAKRGKLPEETRSYVRNITGQAAETWVSGTPRSVSFRLPARAPCQEIAALSDAQTVPLPPPRLGPHAVYASAAPTAPVAGGKRGHAPSAIPDEVGKIAEPASIMKDEVLARPGKNKNRVATTAKPAAASMVKVADKSSAKGTQKAPLQKGPLQLAAIAKKSPAKDAAKSPAKAGKSSAKDAAKSPAKGRVELAMATHPARK